jgi:hypothetical protein
MLVSNVIDASNLLNPGGKLLVTRKNPHVIGAGLGPDMPANCWYIIAMVTCTMLALPI